MTFQGLERAQMEIARFENIYVSFVFYSLITFVAIVSVNELIILQRNTVAKKKIELCFLP